ncbi:MAG: NUDIX domain-containing protein [Bacteroidales bacterium]|jgi:8-oxo-dGTP pyrophosphatase MutT (NUDIX family)|nr:NUDIX domain-containing protein [Bacteroidales bacterium]
MQRYKLFYNETVFSTVRFEQNVQPCTAGENCFVYEDVSDGIEAIILLFLHKNQSVTMVCKTDEEEKNLWKEIKKYFIFQRAAGGIVFKDNAILSIYRFDRWDFPKGHVEEGETDRQAAIREVMEETGIEDLSICKDLDCTYHVFPLDDRFVLKETHWYQMQTSSNGKLVAQTEENIEKAVWISRDRLNIIGNNMYFSLVDLLKRNNFLY